MGEERKLIEALSNQIRAMQEDFEDTIKRMERRIKVLEQQAGASPDVTAFTSLLEDHAYTMSMVEGTGSDNDFPTE